MSSSLTSDLVDTDDFDIGEFKYGENLYTEEEPHEDTFEEQTLATYNISDENEVRTFEDSDEKAIRVGAIRLNEQALESLTGGLVVSAKIAKLLENPVETFEKNAAGFTKRYENQFRKLDLGGILPS